MKITDEELLQCIFANQLRRTAQGVLHRYVGDRYGLINQQDNSWIVSAMTTSTTARHCVTTKISKQQLLHRLRDLGRQGELKIDHFSFYIESCRARQAVETACEYWRSIGVPVGFDNDNGRMRCVPLPHFQQNLNECIATLDAKFLNNLGAKSWNQTAKLSFRH
ncbi:hypothetical protein AAEJ42_02255 [Shewanella algae]|uniref:hypothetical protein n=1 Tax=Shewanella algae TaxID=38313 RepID=UPI00313C3B82